MTVAVANVELTDSFLVWIHKFNQAATALREEVVTVDTPIAGDLVLEGALQTEVPVGQPILRSGSGPGTATVYNILLEQTSDKAFTLGGWNGTGWAGTLNLNFFEGVNIAGDVSVQGAIRAGWASFRGGRFELGPNNLPSPPVYTEETLYDNLGNQYWRRTFAPTDNAYRISFHDFSAEAIAARAAGNPLAPPEYRLFMEFRGNDAEVLFSGEVTTVFNGQAVFNSAVNMANNLTVVGQAKFNSAVDVANNLTVVGQIRNGSNQPYIHVGMLGAGLVWDGTTLSATAKGGSGVVDGAIEFGPGAAISLVDNGSNDYYNFTGAPGGLRLNGTPIPVLPSSGSAGQIPVFNGTGYTLQDQPDIPPDIVVAGTEDGQPLRWDATAGKYVPGTPNDRWVMIVGSTTLQASLRYVAQLSSNADFALPATVTPGDAFAIHVVAPAGVRGRIVVGAGRQISGLGVGDNLLVENGATVSLVALTPTLFQIVQAGCI